MRLTQARIAELDRGGGEDATFGMVWDCPSLPALFEAVDPRPQNSVLAEFIDGRSSTRYFDVVDAKGWRFLWGISEGQPVFVHAARASQGVQVVLDPFLFDLGPTGGVLLHQPAHKRTVVGADGELRAGAAEQPLPGVEILRAATQRIRAGETVQAATRAFLGDLWKAAGSP